jgi:3-deoxy-manno-octulosonate cytidylyltransferase (CMP-KDO synthetase)
MGSIVGIIPARFASSRFPGKPLIEIIGKSMIQRVYERATLVIENVVVATDDKRIYDAVIAFGGNAVMTMSTHRSGTDRCAEALEKYEMLSGKKYSVIVNIQGDEPFIRKDQIEMIVKCFEDKKTEIATLIKPIIDNSVVFDPNRPKVIIDKNNFALYFSRSPIPFVRDIETSKWSEGHQFYQHIGMYAYRESILKEITLLPPSILEKAESLEQLRWIENGYKIKTAITEFESYGIDTPQDLERVLKLGLISDRQ